MITVTGMLKLAVSVGVASEIESDWYRVIAWNKANQFVYERFGNQYTMTISDEGVPVGETLVFDVIVKLGGSNE